jgi:hypothetical protein
MKTGLAALCGAVLLVVAASVGTAATPTSSGIVCKPGSVRALIAGKAV